MPIRFYPLLHRPVFDSLPNHLLKSYIMQQFGWFLGILFFCLVLVGVIATFSKTKPQNKEEGDRYPFDERDIYSQNGQDEHKKSA